MRRYVLLCLVLLLILSSSGLYADTITFQEGDGGFYSTTYDLYLNPRNRDFASGSQGVFWTDYTTQDGYWTSFVMFPDIIGSEEGQIAEGSIIHSATLTIKTTDNPIATSIYVHYLYQVTTAWNLTIPQDQWETTVTFNNFGSSPGSGGVDGTDWDSAALASFTPATTEGLSILDVTSSLVEYLNSGNNFGWAIRTYGNNDGSNIYSSDISTVEYRPLLTVEYTPPVIPETVPEPMTILLVALSLGGFIGKRL